MNFNVQNCPSCGGDDWREDHQRGDMICVACGCTHPDGLIDDTLEKRNFADSDADHSRGSMRDASQSFSSVSTSIGDGKTGQAGILSKAQRRLRPASTSRKEQNIEANFRTLRALQTQLQLPANVGNTAKEFLSEFENAKEKAFHGARSRELVLAAVWLACEKHHLGKSVKELTAQAEASEEMFRKYVRLIKRKIPKVLNTRKSPQDHVAGIIELLGLDYAMGFKVERLARDIVGRIVNNVSTWSAKPTTLAGMGVLFAGEELGVEIDAENVATASDIGRGTLVSKMARVKKEMWAAMYLEGELKALVAKVMREGNKL